MDFHIVAEECNMTVGDAEDWFLGFDEEGKEVYLRDCGERGYFY